MRRFAARAFGPAAILAAVLAAVLALAAPAGADPALPTGFQDETVFAGIEQPTNFAFAPDGRVFVTTKPGEILVYDDLDDDLPDVFADLRGSVYDSGDRGLLGLALDPKFDQGRPYVYALYTWDHVLGTGWDPADPEYGKPGTVGDPTCPTQNPKGNCLVSGRLVRLTENPLNPNHATEAEGRPVEQELLQGWCQQFDSHSVGDLGFGPEDALYVSGGDGASYESQADYGQLGTNGYQNACADPSGGVPVAKGTPLGPPDTEGGALRSQNLGLLNGAILRVDPDTGAAFPGNPLSASGDPNARRTVAKGFRNPFRFAFDPNSGELYSGNVGSSEIEEIDRFQVSPTTLFNSGWPCYEGIQPQFKFKDITEDEGLSVCEKLYDASPSVTSLPLFSYSHSQAVVPNDECPTDAGSAVGGLSIYGGSRFPAEFKGALFFADAVRGCIWVMLPGSDGKPDPSKTTRFLREASVYPGVKIAEHDGYLYYADLLGEAGAEGSIHRIAYRPGAPTAKLKADPPYGLYDSAGELSVGFDASGSSDPTQSSAELKYEWDLDEDGVFEVAGSDQTKTLVFTEQEQEDREDADPAQSPNRTIAVRVEDGEELTSVARVTVYPGDKPPVPTITGPAPAFKWAVGDEIKLDASALDADGSPITTPLPYYWVTRLAHCPNPANPTACHVHPLQTFSGIRRPTFIAPQHDYPSYIEVVLRVSDDRGLSGATSMEIHPRTASVSVTSDPPGIPLTAGSTEAASPFATPAIEGSEIQLSAPPTAELDGRTYTWQGWSDGGPASHSILIAGDASYKAVYSTPDPEPEPDPDPDPVPDPGRKTEPDPGRSPDPIPPVLPLADTTAPETKLLSHPARKTPKKTARFAFSASESGSSFRCKLDRGAFKPCASPLSYKGLKAGSHSFKVFATDAAGNADPSPAGFGWKVTAPQPRR